MPGYQVPQCLYIFNAIAPLKHLGWWDRTTGITCSLPFYFMDALAVPYQCCWGSHRTSVRSWKGATAELLHPPSSIRQVATVALRAVLAGSSGIWAPGSTAKHKRDITGWKRHVFEKRLLCRVRERLVAHCCALADLDYCHFCLALATFLVRVRGSMRSLRQDIGAVGGRASGQLIWHTALHSHDVLVRGSKSEGCKRSGQRLDLHGSYSNAIWRYFRRGAFSSGVGVAVEMCTSATARRGILWPAVFCSSHIDAARGRCVAFFLSSRQSVASLCGARGRPGGSAHTYDTALPNSAQWLRRRFLAAEEENERLRALYFARLILSWARWPAGGLQTTQQHTPYRQPIPRPARGGSNCVHAARFGDSWSTVISSGLTPFTSRVCGCFDTVEDSTGTATKMGFVARRDQCSDTAWLHRLHLNHTAALSFTWRACKMSEAATSHSMARIDGRHVVFGCLVSAIICQLIVAGGIMKNNDDDKKLCLARARNVIQNTSRRIGGACHVMNLSCRNGATTNNINCNDCSDYLYAHTALHSVLSANRG